MKKAFKGIDQVNIDRHKKEKKSYWRYGRDRHQTLNYFATKATNGKIFPPASGKESTAATGNKKTYKGTPNPVKPKKKKRKSDNSALVRFLETPIIINTPFPSRIVEFDNFNNNLDYIVVTTYI